MFPIFEEAVNPQEKSREFRASRLGVDGIRLASDGLGNDPPNLGNFFIA
ncbi:hypothetical protein [Fodinibius sp. AD559]